MFYELVGRFVVWAAVGATVTGALYVAAHYVFAIIRLVRVLKVNIREGIDPWPNLEGWPAKARAFFRNAWWLMIGTLDAVYDDGRVVPYYPWQSIK